MTSGPSDRRAGLLRFAAEFVRAATQVPGVESISLLGSICTDRPHPKDIDFLVVVGEDVDLALLAVYGRRLKGRAQGLSSGADIFLVNSQRQYIGRICHYRDCWPRRTCQALHCGQTPHLNDDLEILRLSNETIDAPPVTIWPELNKRCPLPIRHRLQISPKAIQHPSMISRATSSGDSTRSQTPTW
jgi:hypothetical protein